MNNRITNKDLENLLSRINAAAGFNNPQSIEYNTIGSYYLDFAYGGVKLVRIVSSGGGQTNITHGYNPKRETYNAMQAFLLGMGVQS